MNDFVERLDNARSWTSSFGLGVAVILLYIFLVGLVFIGFASYIVRADWQAQIRENRGAAPSQFSSSNQFSSVVTEIDVLVHLLNREEQLNTLILKADEDVIAVREKENRAKNLVGGIQLRIDQHQRDAADLASSVFAAFHSHSEIISEVDKKRVTDVMKNDDHPMAERGREIVSQFTTIQVLTGTSANARSAFRKDVAELASAYSLIDENLTEAFAEHSIASDALTTVYEEGTEPKKRLETLRSELRDLGTQIPINSRDRAQYGTLASIGVGQVIVKIVSLPTIFLTLIVTIASGGLGSVVSFSRRFNSGDESLKNDTSARRLFVNLGEGVAAALAIFLFSGAGMLALSTGGSSGTEQIDLSPYAVAFVAFVSGFMAEDAFAYIQGVGTRFFTLNQDANKGGQQATVKPATPEVAADTVPAAES